MGTAAARSPTIRAQPTGTRARSGQVAPLVVVAGLTLLALVLRATQIHQSLEGDEVFTYQDIFGHSFTSVLSTVHSGGENSPPLFFLMAWATAKLGDPTVWIRLPSIVLGTATIPVIYILGRQTVGRAAGVVGAAIVAVAPFAVFYGIEARPYATMTFFVTASTVFVIRAVRERRVVWWVAYVVCAVAAAYCHYTCIFLLLVQGLWALWACRDDIKIPLIAHVTAAVLYLPWLPYLRGKELAVIAGLHPLTPVTVLTDLIRVLPGFPFAYPRQIPTLPGLIVFLICLVAGAVAFFMARRRPSGDGVSPAAASSGAVTNPGDADPTAAAGGQVPGGIGLLGLLTLATPVGLLVYSLLATDLWLSRGLSASLPAAALVLGALLVRLPRPAMVTAVAATLAVLVFGTAKSLTTAYAREDYRGMAAFLDRNAGPRDRVVLFTLLGQPAIPAMATKAHDYVSLKSINQVPQGGRLFLVDDTDLAKDLHIPVPRPAGFHIAELRRYPGPFPADIIVYARNGT